MKVWMRNPHAGGVPIPPTVQDRARMRIIEHAQKHYAGKFLSLDISFRKQFCYIAAFVEPETPSKELLADLGETLEEFKERLRANPVKMCRLRYFNEDQWSVAFYAYSNDKYEPAVFDSGDFFGSPEQGFDLGAVYLQ